MELNPHFRRGDVSILELRVPGRVARPALGMFEVFAPNRAAKFRGPQFCTLQKLTYQLELRTTMIFIWRKLSADTRFDVSLGRGLAFILPSSHCNAGQRIKTAATATRCVLRAYNAAKCDCGRGSSPNLAGGAYSAPQTPSGALQGRPGGPFWLGGPQFIWPHQ